MGKVKNEQDYTSRSNMAAHLLPGSNIEAMLRGCGNARAYFRSVSGRTHVLR
jgi:hypothetical protein